jgi:hypothetical protein
MMRACLLMLVLLGPVVTRGEGCDKAVDEHETCMEICRAKIGRRPLQVEVLGRTGADQWRTCACYMDRTVVVDDLPVPVEKN